MELLQLPSACPLRHCTYSLRHLLPSLKRTLSVLSFLFARTNQTKLSSVRFLPLQALSTPLNAANLSHIPFNSPQLPRELLPATRKSTQRAENGRVIEIGFERVSFSERNFRSFVSSRRVIVRVVVILMYPCSDGHDLGKLSSVWNLATQQPRRVLFWLTLATAALLGAGAGFGPWVCRG